MRIIKLEVERYGERGIKLIKYAVGLDLKRYPKIGGFIGYVQKVCKLDPVSFDLQFDEFLFSKHDKAKALKENVVYKLKIRRSSKKDYQIRSSQVEESEEIAEIKQKIKGQRAIPNNKSKAQQKSAKIVRKKKQQPSSDSDSSSSSSDEEHSSQSQSSSLSSQSQVKAKRQKRPVREEVISQQSSSEEQNCKHQPKRSKEQTPEKDNRRNPQSSAAIPLKKKAVFPKSSSQSSSSEESEQELPTLVQNKRQLPATKAPSKITTPAIPQPAKPAPVKQASNPYINPKKKAIINDDSSSESAPSQYQPKKKPQITSQPPAKVENNKPQAPVSAAERPKNQVKLPPALRNKLVKKNFDQHKQNQWISIDKQKLKKWQELGHKNICQANNKIRFKIIQLDQQKFIPVKSGWISAQVKGVNENGVVSLIKVEQEGKPYRQYFEIPEHNMDELQVNRLLATKQQIDCFEQKQQSDLKQKQPEKPVQQVKQTSLNNSNDKNSLEKFVCGQANYYFSDKNYNFDLFMQMHANRHPEKYLNLSVLLNFPKIKKILADKQKLYEYLKSDEKYEQRNYEIDFNQRLIRKKGIIRPPEQTNNLIQNVENSQKPASEKAKDVQCGQVNPQ